jgi:hypothetical protein
MTKRQLIDEIHRFNNSAKPEFLSQFDEAALRQYLEHLQAAQRKHAVLSHWVRPQPERIRMAS